MKGGSERMCNRKIFLVFLVCTMLILGVVSSGFCFGKKELEHSRLIAAESKPCKVIALNKNSWSAKRFRESWYFMQWCR